MGAESLISHDLSSPDRAAVAKRRLCLFKVQFLFVWSCPLDKFN